MAAAAGHPRTQQFQKCRFRSDMSIKSPSLLDIDGGGHQVTLRIEYWGVQNATMLYFTSFKK